MATDNLCQTSVHLSILWQHKHVHTIATDNLCQTSGHLSILWQHKHIHTMATDNLCQTSMHMSILLGHEHFHLYAMASDTLHLHHTGVHLSVLWQHTFIFIPWPQTTCICTILFCTSTNIQTMATDNWHIKHFLVNFYCGPVYPLTAQTSSRHGHRQLPPHLLHTCLSSDSTDTSIFTPGSQTISSTL